MQLDAHTNVTQHLCLPRCITL